MSRRVLLLATTTGYQTRAFGDAAKRLGVELVFATDRCDQIDDPWQDGAIAIRFHAEESSVATIVEASRHRRIDAILAVGDRPTVIAAKAARALGLPWHPADAAAVARHKLLTRQRLRDAGLPVPWFRPLAIGHQPPDILEFPCVIKPVALAGSRGVMRADDPESFRRAFERLRALMASPDIRAERSAAHDMALVEGFVPGREYAVEGVMHHGELNVFAVFDKPDPLDGPFFEETIYLTPSSAAAGDQRRIVEAITQAASAIGLRHGPIHAECRVTDAAHAPNSTVFVLEVAARPIGGLCARALAFEHDMASINPPGAPPPRITTPRAPTPRITTPGAPTPRRASSEERITLEELLLRHGLGEPPWRWRRERQASGVMMIPIPRRGTFRSVEGVAAAKAVAHVLDLRITAKPDQLLVPLPEGASYLGFIFARAGTPTEAERALRAAHACLQFEIGTEFPVLSGSEVNYNHANGADGLLSEVSEGVAGARRGALAR